MPQVSLVQVAGGAGVRVQPAGIERRPPTVAVRHQVGDQHVGVQMWIGCPAGTMEERGRHHPLDGDVVAQVAVASTGGDRHPLEVARRRRHRGFVGEPDLVGGRRVPEGVAERDGLGRGEHQIEPGDADAVLGGVESLAGGGVGARQDGCEVRRADGSAQSQRSRRPPQPRPVRLLARPAVVLGPSRHRVQVVPLAAPSDLGDAQHGRRS